MNARIGERLHSLDGVRALAASLIVVHHLGVAAAATKLFEAGHLAASALLAGLTAGGVELFFVLSGVVLGRPHLRDGRPITITGFYLRRARRLYPPFLAAWLLSGFAVYMATAHPTWWTPTSNLPTFGLVEWVKQVGILNLGVKAYNFAWWSLSVEIVFYLAFPLLVLLVLHLSVSSFALFLLMASAVCLSEISYEVPFSSVTILNQLFIYFSCFCAGLLLAATDISLWTRGALAASGLLWIVCSAFTRHLNPHVGWGLVAFAFVSAATAHGTLRNHLSRPFLVWLGERSYSIFLTHYAVITLVCLGVSGITQSKGAPYFFATRVMSVPLLLLTGMILFHCVERRFAKDLATAESFWPFSIRMPDLPVFAPPPPTCQVTTRPIDG